MASSGRTADDTGSDISAEVGPVDVALVSGGLEHGTVRRLGDVQVINTSQRYCSLWNARSNM